MDESGTGVQSATRAPCYRVLPSRIQLQHPSRMDLGALDNAVQSGRRVPAAYSPARKTTNRTANSCSPRNHHTCTHAHNMSQSREVLAMMDNHAHTTTFGRKRGCIHKRLTRCDAFFLGALFMAGVISTALLVYHFAPCLEEKQVKQCDDFFGRSLLQIGENFSMTSRSAKRLDVRLPRSIVPDSYELWLIPFIWKGNFTFRGEVKILMNVTTDTSNVTLHAVDLKIDEGSTNIGEILAGSNKTKSIGIAEQRNDTEREFHVIKTSSTLKSGKQYVLHLKFIGTLNDYMQGFYRSSYMVGTETRWIASTQFQATDARRAFPCFDEPALKARFQINIARPRNMTSMSNMPRRGEPTAVFT